jgi:translation initiation factor IF-2
VQEGTLHVGDSFVSRHNFGKVRALIGDTGAAIHEAGPATPVEVIGFASVPEAGDKFIVIDEKKARQTSIYWQQKRRAEDLRKDARVSLENFFSTIAEADSKELRLIIKADVQGSLEALKQSLEPLSTEEIKVQVIHNSVGSISLNDVMLASASNAIIIGFGVKTEPKVEDTADQEQVDIRLYNIIYDVIDDVKKAMSGMLAPKLVEKFSGKAEVRQLFAVSKTGTVAGCFVVEGRMLSGSKARVLRGADIIYEGSIASLKRFKDDAREVLAGQDCGIFLTEFKEFAVGDIVESFTQEEVQRKL